MKIHKLPQEKYLYLPNPKLTTNKTRKIPAVLILHEITGITEHTKRVAKKFTEAGYIAVTPDLFGDKRIQKIFKEMPRLFEKAQKEGKDIAELNKKINERLYKILNSKKFIDTTINKLNQCIDSLKSLGTVDANNISVIGFSFGGWYAFKLAQLNDDIRKVVIFYGFYDLTEKIIKEIKHPILGFYGELESNVNEIQQIKELAKKHQKSIKIYMCKQAKHSFFNDTNPRRYNKKASDFAWEKILKFLSGKK